MSAGAPDAAVLIHGTAMYYRRERSGHFTLGTTRHDCTEDAVLIEHAEMELVIIALTSLLRSPPRQSAQHSPLLEVERLVDDIGDSVELDEVVVSTHDIAAIAEHIGRDMQATGGHDHPSGMHVHGVPLRVGLLLARGEMKALATGVYTVKHVKP